MTPALHTCLALAFLLSLGSPGHAEEDLNNGEDFTRPPSRFDFRYQFQDKGGGVEQSTFLLRMDRPVPLSESWELAFRFDLPSVLNNGTSSDNPRGDARFGLGDFFAQAALINTVTDRFAYGGGVRMLFPTASEDQFGSGKYRLIPILGVRYKLPWISKGSFAQFVARYDFDVGGYAGRKHVSQFQCSPTLNIALPDRWFVTLFPSQDIVFNVEDGGKWFVPADFSIGRNLTERVVTSLEISVPIVKEFTLYDFKLEARLSYSF